MNKSEIFKAAWKKVKSGMYDNTVWSNSLLKSLREKFSWALKDVYFKLKTEKIRELHLSGICPDCGKKLKIDKVKDFNGVDPQIGYAKIYWIKLFYCDCGFQQAI